MFGFIFNLFLTRKSIDRVDVRLGSLLAKNSRSWAWKKRIPTVSYPVQLYGTNGAESCASRKYVCLLYGSPGCESGDHKVVYFGWCGGMGGGGERGVSANEYLQLCHEAQINFGDIALWFESWRCIENYEVFLCLKKNLFIFGHLRVPVINWW